MVKATQSDIGIINLLHKSFYKNSQLIIEAFYLQRMAGSSYDEPEKKADVHDGVIERQVHGGMHAGRTQFYVKILHKKFSELFPQFTHDVLQSLETTLGINEKQLLTLTRYAALFHDSARKDEGQDLWNKESAQNCYEYFTKDAHLSPALAKVFLKACQYKDKPEKYFQYLMKNAIDPKDIRAFDYIRKLIYLADCLDIMRCTGEFEFVKVIDTLRDIPGYKTKLHEHHFLQMAKRINVLIRRQKDMVFNCKILLPDGSKIKFLNSNDDYNLAHKVKFEHAKNVCSALGKSMMEDEYFAKYLSSEPLLSTELATCKPAFNPYIHGTNSRVLATMRKTRHQLMSPVQMLEQFGAAPFGGEIIQGGLRYAAVTAKPAFARLRSEEYEKYNLDRIINSFAKKLPPDEKEIVMDARNVADYAMQSAYCNINILLIYLARAKQIGVEPFTKDEYAQMKKEINATIQVFYLFLLLGKHIFPNKILLKMVGKQAAEDIACAVYTHLTLENLAAAIIKSGIDIKHAYEHPNLVNIAAVIKLLQLPKISKIIQGGMGRPKMAELPVTQIFSQHHLFQNDYPDHLSKHTGPFLAISQNRDHDNFQEYLEKFVRGRISTDFFTQNKKSALRAIAALTKDLGVLERLESTPVSDMQISSEDEYFLKHNIPMILVYDNEEKIKLFAFDTQEYRAEEPLQLGKDIKMIATDNEEHRLMLMKYLDEHKINHMQVVLFSDLEQAKKDLKAPRSPYTDQSGFPKLSWLAAKKVPEHVLPPNSVENVIDAGNTYNRIRFK